MKRLCKPGPAVCIKGRLPNQQASQGLAKEAHRPSQVQLCALKEGSLTSKLVRALLKKLTGPA
eukprot:1158365-Pelagomonas_calceolata.AAC.12